MKKWLSTLILTVSIAGVNGCVSTNDIEVESVTNEKVNLKAYKRYQFMKESGIVESDGKGKLVDSDKKVAALVEEIINEALQKKGKTPVAKDPDFFVAYVGGTDKDAVKVKLDDHGKEIVESAPEAALLIMLIDAQTGAVLKVSTAEGEFKSLTPEEKKARIEYAVKKMLKDL
jgi:hypothetical protein